MAQGVQSSSTYRNLSWVVWVPYFSACGWSRENETPWAHRPAGLDSCWTPGSPRDLVFQTKLESEEERVGDDICPHVGTHGRLHVYEPACVFTCTHTYTHSLSVCRSLKYIGTVAFQKRLLGVQHLFVIHWWGYPPTPCVNVCLCVVCSSESSQLWHSDLKGRLANGH